MRPAVERKAGGAVHVPVVAADEDLGVGNGRLAVRIEPVGEARRALLEDQGAPGRAERARPSPTLERHPQRQVERARIGDRDPVAGAVQRDGGAKAARRRPAGAAQRAVVAGARGIGGRVARALVEGVGADEPGRGGWWWWWWRRGRWWRWGRRGGGGGGGGGAGVAVACDARPHAGHRRNAEQRLPGGSRKRRRRGRAADRWWPVRRRRSTRSSRTVHRRA